MAGLGTERRLLPAAQQHHRLGGRTALAAYIQLTEAEAAFRIQKGDLRIRPIWHQKEERVQAHILVCFLAYVLWKTLGRPARGPDWAMSRGRCSTRSPRSRRWMCPADQTGHGHPQSVSPSPPSLRPYCCRCSATLPQQMKFRNCSAKIPRKSP